MRPVDRLPDCYRKDPDSNNYKLLELNSSAADDLRDDILMVCESLDLNKATGKTLDLYGEMLQQRRGQLNDVQYRYMLYSRIGRNVVQGDYDSIMKVLLLMFGCTWDDIDLDETETSCEMELTRFPMFVLVNAGFSSRQAVDLIELLLPTGVSLRATHFEGSFEFADGAEEYDENTGFADIDQIIGGYLGLLLGDDDKIPILPI